MITTHKSLNEGLFDFPEVNLDPRQHIENIDVTLCDFPFLSIETSHFSWSKSSLFIFLLHNVFEHLKNRLFNSQDELVLSSLKSQLFAVQISDVMDDVNY